MKPRLLPFGVFLFLGACSAATVNVPGDSSSIQSGILGASTSDTVLVAPGSYTENFDFLGKAILLLSSGGRDSTFIEPADTALPIAVFQTAEDSASVIEGFTFRHTSGAPAISCHSASPIITNCDFTECRASTSSAVIECDSSSVLISGNRIYQCIGSSASEWACIRISGYTLDHPRVVENEVFENSGGVVYGIVCANLGAGTVILKNVIWGNYSETPALGAGVWTAQSIGSRIIGNTIVANTRGIRSIDRKQAAFDFDSTDIRNNIIAYNFMEGLDAVSSKHDFNDIFNNGIQPWVLEPREIADDPLFVDAANHDYHLQPISPCINSGDPDSAYMDRDGTCADMGAYYFDLSPRCGDTDASGSIDIDDVIFLIEFIFRSGPAPVPYEHGDVDCVDPVDIDDVVYLISYTFLGGPPPCDQCSE